MKISGAHICLSTDRLENSFGCGAMLSQNFGVIGGIPFEKRRRYCWSFFSFKNSGTIFFDSWEKISALGTFKADEVNGGCVCMFIPRYTNLWGIEK